MFVCSGVFVPSFSPMWRRHHYRWRTTNFDLYSALMAIEQWGFFNVPHLLHGASVYNGHLRRPVGLTPVVERLALELSLDLGLSWLGIEPRSPACEADALALRHDIPDTDTIDSALRVLFDLVIRACQLDMIRHFGSSYCYDNIYVFVSLHKRYSNLSGNITFYFNYHNNHYFAFILYY